ncbi:phage/plasmid primase, P4 family [Lachnoclostridium pacaense]|jgi:putative DNA primase/helicase|uniref:DNA primase family protein n=1 Tax=Enterocloster hominis (ex Hitch et al. 2024) TaxID=1917870 RepID=UPI001D12998E|nr:DNA primase family protein [Lachnoclostridium pacaense]MCC2819545.1 phage/plasmid primase, P4 family [Lachnoclostridium pacaense]
MLYKGYVETKGKQSIEKLKNRTKWKTYEEVKNLSGFGGVLADDTILIDIDDSEQSEILMNIVEDLQLDCKVLCTSRGKHFLFKNHTIARNRTHVQLAVGLTADIKVGSKLSYEVIKIDGEERFCEWDIEEGGKYQEVPKWLFPVKATAEFVDMDAGDGRNQALFNYILTLTANDFTVDETRECIRILNKFVLKEPLSDEELEVILRDEAFQKPVFFMGSTFLFDKFAVYMKNTAHVVKINGQLHIYKDGIYTNGYKEIESDMIQYIPNLKKMQRREVLDYMELIVEEKEQSDANLIAFNNGIYDLVTGELKPFSTDIVITNKIPWDYNPDAYFELADKTLNKLACDDAAIRALLEECIGYCFYRRNELGKAFILTGDKNNGKSTFLDIVKTILGDKNISALDLKELGDRFNTSMMFGKMANIGDDIGDDFLQGSQVSIFKKIVTGNRIKAERKGQDPFEFNPFIKLLFSANDIPRMKDKTGAVLRRLVIIPFNARFSKYLPDGVTIDPDFDPFIKYKLIQKESIEYLIKLGVEGLKRVITNNEFTKSEKVQGQLDEYEEENNPIIAFIADCGVDMIENEPTNEVYKRYQVFCAENSMQPMSNIVFSKQINKRLDLEISIVKLNGQTRRIFKKR